MTQGSEVLLLTYGMGSILSFMLILLSLLEDETLQKAGRKEIFIASLFEAKKFVSTDLPWHIPLPWKNGTLFVFQVCPLLQGTSELRFCSVVTGESCKGQSLVVSSLFARGFEEVWGFLGVLYGAVLHKLLFHEF